MANGKDKLADHAQVTTIYASKRALANEQEKIVELKWIKREKIGSGSFGVVFKAQLIYCGDTKVDKIIAIKKVLLDKRYKNRELQIMKDLTHINLINLLYYYYTHGDNSKELYLNLIIEYLPYTLYQTIRVYAKRERAMPLIWIKIFTYQLFRGLAYLHRLNYCHRDIKPQNLLINDETGILKLCDFGSAKLLEPGEASVAYICSRYYRAPELMFGCVKYTTQIDLWSVGCVIGEMMIGRPLFPGNDSVDQLVEIIKVLGTPTKEDIDQMNPEFRDFRFPQITPHPWKRVLLSDSTRTYSEIVPFIENILVYPPNKRITAVEALGLPFFNSLGSQEMGDPNQIVERLILDQSLSVFQSNRTVMIPKLFDFNQEGNPNLSHVFFLRLYCILYIFYKVIVFYYAIYSPKNRDTINR
ncbi:unnamed protein product [Dimorphilus gyrociliatus]|uniref:Protein kinase domain-containing protein n=1 Tax=Dimorphilus gyrociliatus TaxID=2664684 RepID=A0A7I8W791_9ANNE|nr:unnamed protein product [Dimorphilus gyrociliatus]